MKIIDRYLYQTYLVPLCYCLAAFGMIYVIYDLFDNMEDFIKAETAIGAVVQYYLMLIPAVMIYIVPISLMLSVLYCLSQMTKANEITAMRSCGIGLYRIVTPFIVVGFIASLFVLTVNETVGPWAAWQTEQFLMGEKHKGVRNVHLAENFPFKNEAEHRIWFITTFDKKTYDMTRIRVTQQRPDESDEFQILAETGQWLDGRWVFSDLSIQYYDENGYPMGPPEFKSHMEMSRFNETPKKFLTEIKDPHLLSALDLKRYVERHQQFSERDLVKYEVDMHNRLAMPWTCIVVTLLGIPFGYQTGRKGALMGIVASITLFFAFYTLSTVALGMAKQQQIPPWLGAWMSNIVFFFFSIVMIVRMR